MTNDITVRYVDPTKSSWANSVTVRGGTTVGEFFKQQSGGSTWSSHMVRVNRQECTPDQVLQDGDMVSASPTKIHGALAA